MPTRVWKTLDAQFNKLHNDAQALVEQGARDLMRKHPCFASICIGMGTLAFYDKHGEPVDEQDVDRFSRDFETLMLTAEDAAALVKFKNDYEYNFHDMFNATWSPVKWTGPDGERVTDW